MSREEFRKHIKAACVLRGISLEEFAGLIGVGYPAINAFFQGTSNSPRLAVQMCQAAGVDIRYAYETCGLPIPEPKKEEHVNAA